MKYSTDIDISVPRDRVVALFSDPDTVSEWQESFIRMEYVSGELGQAGNVHNLVHKMGQREMVMKETILKNDLPDFFLPLTKPEVSGISSKIPSPTPPMAARIGTSTPNSAARAL